MTSPLPTVQVLVGFNNGPYDDPATITTVASPAGTLGGHNVWTDITAFVPDIDIKRGRQHELSQFEAGTLSLTGVNNNDGRFNPWNTSGPYYGKLVPMVPVQVRATWNGTTYYLFTGHVNSWAPKWGDVASQFVDIQAADAFRVMAGALLGGAQYGNQVVADGASNYWPFTDSAGSTGAFDVIGSLVAGSANGKDTSGNAILVTFSGPGTDGPLHLQSTGHVDLGPFTASNAGITGTYISMPGITTSGSFSIEFWMKIPSGDFGAWQPTVFGQNDANTTNNVSIQFQNSPNLQMVANFTDSVNTQLAAAVVNYPTDGNWHYVCVTMNSSTRILTLTVDGTSGTSSLSGSAGWSLTSSQTTALGMFSQQETTTTSCGGMQFASFAYYPTTCLSSTAVANHYQLGRGYVQGSVDSQIKSLLSDIGWPSGAENILAAVQQIEANFTDSLINTPALQVLQQLERTEEGALFVDGKGRVTFLDRKTLAGGNSSFPQYGVPQVYFGDDTENLASVWIWDTSTWDSMTWGSMSARYDPGQDMALDDLDIVNQAIVTRKNGSAQVVNNATSQTTYGLKSQSVADALHVSDTASLAHATWIVAKESTPVFRLRSITTNLIDALGEDAVANTPASGQTYSRVAQLLGLDLMYRVRTKRVGVGFEQDALIEHLEHRITANSWDITLALSTTDTYGAWQWGGAQ